MTLYTLLGLDQWNILYPHRSVVQGYATLFQMENLLKDHVACIFTVKQSRSIRDSLTQKVKVLWSFKVLLSIQLLTWHHNPEHLNPQVRTDVVEQYTTSIFWVDVHLSYDCVWITIYAWNVSLVLRNVWILSHPKMILKTLLCCQDLLLHDAINKTRIKSTVSTKYFKKN